MSVISREASHRRPAVAGLFYPADPTILRRDVAQLLEGVGAMPTQPPPKALVVPHAGYVYSGFTAGRAYGRLTGCAGLVRRVVLLGPAHRVPLRGIALPTCAAFDTPLGPVPIDREAADAIAAMDQVVFDDRAHSAEHSLEVHLPFLQHALGEFAVLPLVVGSASPDEVAAVIERLWGDESTLIVVSSDLSHYLPYDDAQRIDQATVATMLQLEPTLTHSQACGAAPVNGLLALARRRRLRPELLDLRNSGDTAGSRDRVVGYAALAFFESASAQTGVDTDIDETAPARGKLLLAHAHAALAKAFGLDECEAASAAFLDEPGATFVTLRVGGRLRGCVGSLAPRRSLAEDVRANAHGAAFNDPRFAPLTAHEHQSVTIEVSVLSVATPIVATSESDLIAQLRPGVDGVILECGSQRATLLPQVWEHLADPRDFVQALKQKAGLRGDDWPPDIRLARYTVEKYRDPALISAAMQPS